MQSVVVHIADKNETAGLGVCDPTNTGKTACSGAREIITIGTGWQLVQAPFALFASNPYYGEGNEMTLDPSSVTGIVWNLVTAPDGGVPVSFNFCVYKVAFY